ncbi:MAG: tRNA dihydrouridine synthase DusB [Clostridia bacterium]|nr:tRNA dihydrouridine synthase DusB [Clostridia bacterium]
MKIKNLEIKNNIFLAPMAGVTDFAFRSICRDFGAGLSYTEMISAKGLIFSKSKKIYQEMLFTLPNEKPCAVQIFGNDPKIMAQVCKLPELQKFDIIDINMGCPAPKIVKNGEGSALLKNLDLAVEVARACVEATDKPVTVKMRMGYGKDENVSIELAKRLEKVGVSAICLHGRTREQFYSGKVDYNAIKRLKESVKIPIIGNGDVFDLNSFLEMQKTGVDAVMVGRGALGRPQIFKFLKNNSESEKILPTKTQLIETIKKHFALLQKVYPENFIVSHMRKHLLWYVKDQPKANQLRLQLCKIESIEEAVKILQESLL